MKQSCLLSVIGVFVYTLARILLVISTKNEPCNGKVNTSTCIDTKKNHKFNKTTYETHNFFYLNDFD